MVLCAYPCEGEGEDEALALEEGDMDFTNFARVYMIRASMKLSP